ncbi:MAG: energy-coupling factor transporter ATPase [Anaeroplasmataceae bacterium]
MIEVRDLYYSYTKNDHALNGVSFDINDGEWISIIGHNGSGKSTISKLLVGLIEPQKGTIKFDDVLLTEKTAHEIRKKIGIVFQNPDNQFVGVNVKYDIAFGLENLRVPRDKMIPLVDEYARKVGMYESLEREPQTLSGGQKQRVAIAGILALNQDIIILDEATSMLDPEGCHEIIELIKALKSEYHKTIITITHDLNFARLSDRIIVLKEGKIIASGTPEEVYADNKILESSNLKKPFSLRLYSKALEDEVISNNKKLMECLWELSLKK